MKTLDSTFTEEKNKLLLKFIRLYTVEDYDGAGANLNLAENDEEITFNGVLYSPFPISVGSIKESSQGEELSLDIVVGNISRLIEGYLQTYDLRRKKVTITYVHRDHLSDTDVKYVETFYVQKYSSSQSVVTFTLRPISGLFNLLQLKLPLGTVTRGGCEWAARGRFKGTECKYAGADTSCNGSLQQCRLYSNVENYGAFPGAGIKRMFT